MTDRRIRRAIADLLAERDAGKTICPSEVARALAPGDWRPLMPKVREVAFAMAEEGAVKILQRGEAVDPRAPLRGPIRLGHATPPPMAHPVTPDGRYFVVRGRLWRMSNPTLPAAERETWVKRLMDARRGLRGQRSADERAAARAQVDEAKRALGERGPVWWTDGAPDFNRKLAKNTPYGDWFARLGDDA